MSNTLYRYTYDDLINPENNRVVVTMKQLSDKCGLPPSTISGVFMKRSVYYDTGGAFKIEKRVYEKAESKTRNNK